MLQNYIDPNDEFNFALATNTPTRCRVKISNIKHIDIFLKCKWDSRVWRKFAKFLVKRKLLHVIKKIKFVEELLKYACDAVNFKIMKYARQINCVWNYGYERKIIKHDRLDIVKWMHNNGFFFIGSQIFAYAAYYWKPQIFAWAQKHVEFNENFERIRWYKYYGPISPIREIMRNYPHNFVNAVIKIGNLHILKIIRNDYFIYLGNTIIMPGNKSLVCMKYLKKCKIDIQYEYTFINKKTDFDMYEWILENLPYDDNFVRKCVQFGKLDILMRIPRAKVVDYIHIAARYGHLRMVAWMVSHKCNKNGITIGAIKSCNVGLVRWIDKYVGKIDDRYSTTLYDTCNEDIINFALSKKIKRGFYYLSKNISYKVVKTYPRGMISAMNDFWSECEIDVFNWLIENIIYPHNTNEVIKSGNVQKITKMGKYYDLSSNLNELHPDFYYMYPIEQIIRHPVEKLPLIKWIMESHPEKLTTNIMRKYVNLINNRAYMIEGFNPFEYGKKITMLNLFINLFQ